MAFNSITFLIFILIFFILWYFISKKNNASRWGIIIFASFVFYGWWDWRFLSLLLITGLIDYFAALGIDRWRSSKRKFLILSLIGNLSILFLFKYSGFFADILENIFAATGHPSEIKTDIPSFFLITPIGISFYTFQSMSYTIDVYRDKLKPAKNILHYFAFLSLFPQLVAGPIVRAYDLLPQLKEKREVTEPERFLAIKLILYGYFKKMVIADGIAHSVNVAFASPSLNQSGLYWWIIITAFALQIYCDFSGYSDIARGIAKLMGLNFIVNFNHPYLSKSMKEFWERWHISLSSWFRDYVYISLGGAKKGKFRSNVNVCITFILSGLWHGASFNFIIWGALHAVYLLIERTFKLPKIIQEKLYFSNLLCTLLVLLQVLIGWIFFRAETLPQALDILKTMFYFPKFFTGFAFKDTNLYLLLLIVFIREIYIDHKAFLLKNQFNFLMPYQKGMQVLYLSILMALIIIFRGPGSEFIYFQF